MPTKVDWVRVEKIGEKRILDALESTHAIVRWIHFSSDMKTRPDGTGAVQCHYGNCRPKALHLSKVTFR